LDTNIVHPANFHWDFSIWLCTEKPPRLPATETEAVRLLYGFFFQALNTDQLAFSFLKF
jgi:hypothetical protein